MLIDLVHNKIIEDTITEKFADSVENGLVALLAGKYGDRMTGIQMYEDHLTDGFMRDGEWYYPMTVITADGAEIAWVKWTVDASFDDGIPYRYMGEEQIRFSLADAVPVEFLNKMQNRAYYYEGGYIRVKVQSTSQNPTFLAGKYSQSFVDELARQITGAISSTLLIHGIEDSNIELHLVFAPATYMEHISEGVTYRRLLLAGKSGAPRDFWIKWRRTDGKGVFTVSDTVCAEDIVFELAEDVSQKIREKEYRFLLARSADKYRNAMGRKTVTEWREIIKRAVKRGEILKLDPPVADEIVEPIAEVIAEVAPVAPATEAMTTMMPAVDPDTLDTADEPIVAAGGATADDFARAMRIAREAVGVTEAATAEPSSDDSALDEITKLAMAALAASGAPATEVSFGDEAEESEEAEESTEEAVAEVDPVADEAYEAEVEVDEPVAEAVDETVDDRNYEDKLRAELEAKIRLEYESRARIRAEEEAARLRREQEQLRAENERLQELARREKEAKDAREAERRSEEAKLRAQIEAQIRAEVREKERLAEAARVAVAEQRRLEEERAERERKRVEEEARIEAERRRAEEAARLEAERAREAERIRREREEKEARARASINSVSAENYNYTRKCVKLIFRRNVDPNITGRIHEIIKATIDYYRKADVYIRIKASVPEPTVVLLDFVQIPEEELELLKNIIKVLGNSGLGIAKAIVE